ncbi:MAG: hypothetical protein AAF346_20580, partial [Pseudomonadota bacterium]
MLNDNLRFQAADENWSDSGRLLHYWAAAVLLTLIWMAFAWPWLSGSVTIPWDAKAHFAPQVQFMAASFGRGELPFWNPYAFSGHPQIADPQAMIFSPPMLALSLINHSPSLWAIDAAVLAMLLVAGFGVLWLAYDLEWHWAGALVAALGFAFGAAMAWRLQHFGQVFSLAYLPFVLVLLRRAMLKQSLAYGAVAGVVAAFLVLGRDQVALLCVYVLVGYVVWQWCQAERIGSEIVRTLPALLSGAIIGGTIIALPVLMTLQLAEISNRPSIDYAGAAAGSLHPALLVTGAVPHLFGAAGEMADYWGPPSFVWEDTGLFIAQNMGLVYIGSISLLLLVLGLVRGYLFERAVSFFAIAWILVLLYALGWYTPFFRAAYEVLPGVDLYRRPADAVFVIGGLGGLLAGYCAHRFLTELDLSTTLRQWLMLAGLAALPFLLAIGFAGHFDRLEQASTPLAIAIVWFVIASVCIYLAFWLKPIRPVWSGLLLVLPLAADLIFNNGPNGASALPASALEMLETNSPNKLVQELKSRVAGATTSTERPRVELAGLGFHWPNASLSHRLEHTLGYNPVRLNIYSNATGAGDSIGSPGQRKFPPLMPHYDSQLARMLGLEFVVTPKPIEAIKEFPSATGLKLVAKTPQGVIYENAKALPRVMFVSGAKRANFEQIIASGVWPGVDFKKTVLLEADVPVGRSGRGGDVRLKSYTNTIIEIEVQSPDGGWLVLNDTWHPWWYAEIDGRPVEVHRANVIFRAVQVQAGRHTVRFEFRPVSGVLK